MPTPLAETKFYSKIFVSASCVVCRDLHILQFSGRGNEIFYSCRAVETKLAIKNLIANFVSIDRNFVANFVSWFTERHRFSEAVREDKSLGLFFGSFSKLVPCFFNCSFIC